MNPITWKHSQFRPSSRRQPLARLVRPILEQLEDRCLLSTNVLTYHNNNGRTGQDLTETTLTPDNVNADTFGQVASYSVDGQVYGEPLYMAGVELPDGSTHDVVFAVTEHASVFAFDAHGGGLLWQTSFIDPNSGITPLSTDDIGGCDQIAPEIGITATPVIDAASGTIYVAAQIRQEVDGVVSYHQQLHALDVATGAEKFGGPVEIEATVPGIGDGGDTVTFDPLWYKARPGLLLLNNVVYVAFSSDCDTWPAHGWVMGYDAQTMQQVSVFCTTPNGQLATIWQGGDGLAADADGNIYFMTGNGKPHQIGLGDYTESFVRLSTQDGGLSVADYFSPYYWRLLDQRDIDLGSGGPLLLPPQFGNYPDLMVGAGKEGTIYLLDRHNLGGGNIDYDDVVQELRGAIRGGSWGTPTYFDAGVPWERWIYYAGNGDYLKAFQLERGQLSTTPTSESATFFGYPGATPSLSANGTTDGIVWALKNGNPAVLYAYDALDVGTELYDSNQAGGRDQLDAGVKFATPTIADGQVFVGTADTLTIFGLLTSGPGPFNVHVATGLSPAGLAMPVEALLDRNAGRDAPSVPVAEPPGAVSLAAFGLPGDPPSNRSDGASTEAPAETPALAGTISKETPDLDNLLVSLGTDLAD
jgi:hypothetical protein